MDGAESRSRVPVWLWGAALLIVGVCGGTIAATWLMKLPERALAPAREPNPKLALQAVAPRVQPPARPGVPQPTMTSEFFEKHVMRLLELERGRNLAAVDSSRRRLDDKFRGYSEKVPAFVTELNSLSIKYRVVKALVQDKVQSSHEMRQVSAELFAKYVVSDSQFHADMEDLVAQFQRDLDANRGMITSAFGPGISLSAVSDPTAAASLELLARESREDLHQAVEKRAAEVPVASMESLLAGVVAAKAVRQSATEKLAESGTELPIIGSKTAEVGGTARDLAGAAAYWQLQAHFESGLTSSCRESLDKMRDALWADPRNGLEARLTGLVELTNVAHEMALRRALLGGAPAPMSK